MADLKAWSHGVRKINCEDMLPKLEEYLKKIFCQPVEPHILDHDMFH